MNTTTIQTEIAKLRGELSRHQNELAIEKAKGSDANLIMISIHKDAAYWTEVAIMKLQAQS